MERGYYDNSWIGRKVEDSEGRIGVIADVDTGDDISPFLVDLGNNNTNWEHIEDIRAVDCAYDSNGIIVIQQEGEKVPRIWVSMSDMTPEFLDELSTVVLYFKALSEDKVE